MYICGKQTPLVNTTELQFVNIDLIFSLDVKCPSRFWGLMFSLFSTQLTNSSIILQKSVPLGIYCLMSPFAFSLATHPPNSTVYKNRKKFVIPSLFPNVLQILFYLSAVIVCIKSFIGSTL